MSVQKKVLFLVLGIVCALLVGCVEPSPLFGTFADNQGNRISFFEDGTFNAKIQSNGQKNYEGNYNVLRNVMTLTCTSETLTVVSEWDLRGNILYINWPREDDTILALGLYKISN